jgi:hypothetical protein
MEQRVSLPGIRGRSRKQPHWIVTGDGRTLLDG